MERTVCPLHLPLGEYCAKAILEQHSESLPDLTRLVILIPNATSGRALRSELLHQATQKDHQGLLLPPILTFPRWARQNSSFNGIENHLSELLDLVAVLQENESLKALSQADSWSVARELMTLFEQLWLNRVPLPSDREELALRLQEAYQIKDDPPEQLGQEAHIIHLLWEAWNEGSGEILSSGKCYQEALRHLTLPSETEAVYVCGHDRLSAAEVQALHRLDEEAPVCILTRSRALMPLDTSESSSNPPPTPYSAILQDAFAIDTSTLAERVRACREDYSEDPIRGRLSTFVAEQAEPHARGIDIQIRRWLGEGCRNIGLVTEDRKLARRVRALLERAGVQMQDFAGWALSTTSAASAVIRWFDCLNQDFHYLALLDILKSPFVDLGKSPGHLDRVGGFEKFLHRHNIHSGLDNFQKIAAENPEWKDMLGRIKKAASPLRALMDRPTGGEYFGALLKSLDLLGSRACLAGDEVGGRILLELEQMRFQLAQNKIRLSRSQWQALLRRTLEQENYRRKSSQASVSLINLDQAHLARFDGLIVAGMDSRHYPGSDASFLVFNDAVRGDLGLPTRTELRELDLQRFLSLILSSGQVLLTYQKADHDEPLLPSAWWSQIDVFHRLAYATPLEEPSLSMLSLHPDAWVRPTGFQAPEAACASSPSPLSRPELLPGRISASGHQALVDCPYYFYVRDMLRIREVDILSEEMDNMEFGSYVHHCLQAFHTDMPDAPGPWQGVIGEHDAAALSLLQEIGEHFMGQLTPSPSNLVFEERWKMVARRYLQLQKSTETQQSIAEVEQCVEAEIDEKLMLDGRIDRIDEDATGNRIVIDYKTGSQRVSEDAMRSGEQVQLSSYALLAGPIGQAEYWWLGQNPRKPASKTFLGGEDLSNLAEKTHSRLRGMFQSLREQAQMPANGNEKTCAYCYAQGVCRKDLDGGLDGTS